jgi:hypothetical protein
MLAVIRKLSKKNVRQNKPLDNQDNLLEMLNILCDQSKTSGVHALADVLADASVPINAAGLQG